MAKKNTPMQSAINEMAGLYREAPRQAGRNKSFANKTFAKGTSTKRVAGMADIWVNNAEGTGAVTRTGRTTGRNGQQTRSYTSAKARGANNQKGSRTRNEMAANIRRARNTTYNRGRA